MLPIALIVSGVGAVLVWGAITDPPGGIIAELGRVLRGQPTPKASSAPANVSPAAVATALLSGGSSTATPIAGAATAPAPVPATSGAAAAVAYMRSQLGKPYSYAARPPDSWDCSKLTAAAWARGGVKLTPYSYSQASECNRIDRSQLQPGDLLFYFKGTHHVAMYVGGGRLIEAASPASGVVERPAWNAWAEAHFSFAGRPKGAS